jgi:hypothetical protein
MWEIAGKVWATTRREQSLSCSLTMAARIFPFALVCLAAGCESNFGVRQQGDPLLGIHAAPRQLEPSTPPSNATAQATSGPIPPMPSSYTATGTAPVAGGETATPENPRNLRMAGDTLAPPPPSPSLTGGNGAGAAAARGASPSVNVGNPEPVPPVGTTANLATSSGSSVSAANIRTYEDAQQFLKQHHVTWQRMSQDDGEWKFACGIPNPSNPHVNKTYQTNRPFPDLLSAMRAVIAQIEQAPQ